MTGKYYDNTIPIQEYIKKGFSADSLPKIFLNKGYDITLPFNYTIFISPEISNNFRKKTLDWRQIISNFKKVKIASIVYFKSLPTLLKPLFVENMQIHNGDLDFLDDFKNNFNTDNKRNTFKYYHLMGAHEPYVIDDNLNYKFMPYDRDSYKKQAKADLKICKFIFEHMKDNHIFDNSLIVVMSDHGVKHYDVFNVINGDKQSTPVIKSALALMLVKKGNRHRRIFRSVISLQQMEIFKKLLWEHLRRHLVTCVSTFFAIRHLNPMLRIIFLP